eukprot:SAG31_NODE_302_length_18087_cov_97.056982_9_plen_183_part_00
MPPAPRLDGFGGFGGDGCGRAAMEGQSIACPEGLPDASMKQNIPAPPLPGPTWITHVAAVLAFAYTTAGEESMHCAVGSTFAAMVGGGGGGGGDGGPAAFAVKNIKMEHTTSDSIGPGIGPERLHSMPESSDVSERQHSNSVDPHSPTDPERPRTAPCLYTDGQAPRPQSQQAQRSCRQLRP